jgi:hypothetical protein
VSKRWRIEWPPGSGRVGRYTDAECEMMYDLLRQCEEGEITARQLERQVNVIHDLKVYLNASLVEEEKSEPEPEELFEPSTLFPIPEKAQRVLDDRRE